MDPTIEPEYVGRFEKEIASFKTQGEVIKFLETNVLDEADFDTFLFKLDKFNHRFLLWDTRTDSRVQALRKKFEK